MSVNVKMTAIADEIRTLTGTTGKLGLDAMASNVGTVNEEVNVQAGLIAQIMSALGGKTLAGGSNAGSAAIVEGSFSFTVEENVEPMMNYYDLTTTGLNLSSKHAIIILGSNEADLSYHEPVVFGYRTSLDDVLETVKTVNSTLGVSYSIEEKSENEIGLYGTPSGVDPISSFKYIAI